MVSRTGSAVRRSCQLPTAMVKDTDPRAIIEQMKSYSEDLRKKIVAAVERGTSKSETARLFGVGLSSVKRYVGMASSGESLEPRRRGPAGLRRRMRLRKGF
jgi:transposase-like protein